MGFVVPLDVDIIHVLGDFNRDVLHDVLVVKDVLVVVEKLRQQHDGLAILALLQNIQRFVIVDANAHIIDRHFVFDSLPLDGRHHASALLLCMVFDFGDHVDHFLLSLLEIAGQ